MAKHISIDLGTSNTVIAAQNMGVVLNEPSLAAIDLKTNRLVAVGNEAKTLLGKTPKDIRVAAPIKGGAISDFDIANAMLKAFITGTFPKSTIRPKATICVPENITEVEKIALFECVVRSGAKNAYTQETSVSSAIGAGIDVLSPLGNMILDIGGGKARATVLSFGGIVSTTTKDCGGIKMDEAIASAKGRAGAKRMIWARRAAQYEENINSGDPMKLAEVVRDLQRRSAADTMTFSARQLYLRALERMAQEFAVLHKIDLDAASDKIEDILGIPKEIDLNAVESDDDEEIEDEDS